MFRNRQNSQKPNEDLIRRFQKKFAEVVPPNSHRNAGGYSQLPMASVSPTKLGIDHDMKLGSNIQHSAQDPQFMAAMVDPNSLQFMNHISQSHGYYTPNSGGLGAAYQSQRSDLHTPSMGMNMMTPLSLSQQMPVSANNPGMGLDHFDQQYISPHFHNPHPFASQASFAPSAFVHPDTNYEPMDESVEEASLNDLDMQGNAQAQIPTSLIQDSTRRQAQPPGEKFRYNVTLRAPTAMVTHQNEIPVSYLNKGQAYSMFIVDTNPPPANSKPIKYRTYVRISFQEEEQRQKPSSCWQLWKEGRGTSEAHQRGGKLQAVEYVDPIQGGIDDQKNRQIQLASSSFDGFCVTWSPNATTGASECAISVRFNFLSTDFSHSKGVKGIPVRLCSKTQIVSGDQADQDANSAEVCYCRVKLFRDHGAERKLSNDVAHVKKSIEKLRQQIQQNELGLGNYGKRKRSGGPATFKGNDPRASKLGKHKREVSMGSQDGSGKMSVGDDLHEKLEMLQDMFSSPRPVSVLGLRGDDQDDPDRYPIELLDSRDYVKKENNGGTPFGTERTLQTVSPTSSCMSLNSPSQPSNMQQTSLFYDSDFYGSLNTSKENSQPSEAQGDKVVLKHPIKVQRLPSGDNAVPMGYIEAVDIDPTYRPPAERHPRPIACFYIRFPRNEQHQDDYYRAVYLTERTVRDLMDKISMKQRIDPQRIIRVLLVKPNGLRIMVDDDVVRELPDGQDMVVEISESPGFDNSLVDTSDNGFTPAVEVKLRY